MPAPDTSLRPTGALQPQPASTTRSERSEQQAVRPCAHTNDVIGAAPASLEALAYNGCLDPAITDLNDATDKAIEAVAQLLRQD